MNVIEDLKIHLGAGIDMRAADGMKKMAEDLLEELPKLGSNELEHWSIKAKTLVVFETIRQHCEGNRYVKNS